MSVIFLQKLKISKGALNGDLQSPCAALRAACHF
jgi:hypothetical protein